MVSFSLSSHRQCQFGSRCGEATGASPKLDVVQCLGCDKSSHTFEEFELAHKYALVLMTSQVAGCKVLRRSHKL